MSSFQWLSRLWRKEPPMPAMLRIATSDGTPAEAVTLHKTWHPSGRREELQYRTAAGLCLIPWLGTEKRLAVRVSTPEGTVELDVPRDRPDAGRVHDLVLGEVDVVAAHAVDAPRLRTPLAPTAILGELALDLEPAE